MTTPVLLTEHLGKKGKKIAHICLNSPKSLNALSLDMIDLIAPALQHWEADDAVTCVLLEGLGDRAFCAGGDIRALYEGMTGAREASFCFDFFYREYQMDFHIHRYSKPLICLGDGIVMGGGIGMMSGAGYRLVTERSRLSMPEVSIGLYPDVAGSWFLNRMPGKLGLFLGLTGASLNARDALEVGLADYFVASEYGDLLLPQLLDADWGVELSGFHHQVVTVLNHLQQLSLSALPESHLTSHRFLIASLMAEPQLAHLVYQLLAVETDDPWFLRAQQSLASGSPAALAIIHRQLRETKYLSLAEVYRRELNLSMNCAEAGEFAEGIRALLIDKDSQPQWRFKSVAEVDAEWLDQLFQQRWPDDQHPLKSLGV